MTSNLNVRPYDDVDAKNGDDGDDDNSFEIQIPRPSSRYGWLVFACRLKPKTGPFRNFGSETEKLLRTLGGTTPFKDHAVRALGRVD